MNTKQLRQKILDLAIRGKLVPQDPNDEPASVLLERIREEKESLIKEGKIKRDKKTPANPQDDDKSHYGNLPDGWAWARLSILATFAGGKTPSTNNADFWNGSINWVTSKDMKSKYIDDTQIKMSTLGAEQMQMFQPNTLLIVVRSGILRRTLPIAILKTNSTINQDLKAVSFYINEICEYCYYYFSAIEKEILTKYQKDGTTVESINFDDFKEMFIPLPPLAEQQRIVTAIESAFAVIDEIERNKADLQSAVTAAKSKILSLAIRGKLVPQDPDDEPASVLLERIRAEREQLIKSGKIKRGKGESAAINCDDNSHYIDLPDSWEVTTLSQLTNSLILNDGDWILSDNMVSDGEIKLIQLGSVGYMEYVEKGFKYLTMETFTELKCTTIFPNYLLINRLLGDRLNVCILPNIKGTLITTVDTCWIAPNENYDIKYLMYSIASEPFQTNVFLNSAGSTRKRISKGNLIQVSFPLPPLAEQQRIVTAIEAAFAQLDAIASMLT